MFFHPIQAQDSSPKRALEVSAGLDFLIYQSAYNFQNTTGMEIAIAGAIHGPFRWQAGVRMGFDPVLPEGFARLLGEQGYGAWRPAIGIEMGITGRTYFEDGASLLQETRKAMEADINSVYLSGHAAPAKFVFKKGWTVSALEIDLGTHLSHFGRTMRARLNIITIGKRF